MEEGADVTLNCEADALPPPVYHLTSHDVDMSENTNTFTISQLNSTTTYNCTASNYLGRITKQIHVYVINNMSAPAAPTTAPEGIHHCVAQSLPACRYMSIN